MANVEPRRHFAELIGAEDAMRRQEGIWVVERHLGDDRWEELERVGSRADADAALDQIAARLEIDLGDLRVRRPD
jgi:hypothetical protein